MKLRPFSLLLVLVLMLSACAESDNDRRRRRDDDDDDGLKWAENQIGDSEEMPTAPMQVQTILFQREYADDKEYATIIALDADSETVWQLQTQQYDVAQLDSVTEIGMWEDRFYYAEGGKIVALDRETGEILWENEDFSGYPASKDACLVLEDGTILATGFFGPDFIAIDMDGNTLHYISTHDVDIYWPYLIEMENGLIVVTFEGYPEGSADCWLTLDPKTWEVIE